MTIGVSSSYTSSISVGSPSTDWWLKDPQNPAANTIVIPIGESISIESDQDAAAFGPLGRADYLVVSDVIRLDNFDFKVDFISDASFAAFQALRAANRTLLLQSPAANGKQWYVRFTTKMTTVWSNINNPGYRQVTVHFYEVAAP